MDCGLPEEVHDHQLFLRSAHQSIDLVPCDHQQLRPDRSTGRRGIGVSEPFGYFVDWAFKSVDRSSLPASRMPRQAPRPGAFWESSFPVRERL